MLSKILPLKLPGKLLEHSDSRPLTNFDSLFRTITGICLLLYFTVNIIDRHYAEYLFLCVAIIGVVGLYRGSIQKINAAKPVFIAFTMFFLSALVPHLVNDFNEYDIDKLEDFAFILYSLFVLSAILYTRPNPIFFFFGVGLCAFFVGIWTVIDVFNNGFVIREGGPENKPIIFAIISLTSALLSVTAFSYLKDYCSKTFAILIPFIALLFGIFACIQSLTRGAWLFVPGAAVLILLLVYPMVKKHKVLISALIILTIGSISTIYSYNSRIWKKINHAWTSYSISIDENIVSDSSVGARLELWRASVSAFKTSPVFGLGPGGFPEFIRSLEEKNAISELAVENRVSINKSKLHTHAHSLYMNTLATKGLVGLLALAVFIFLPLVAFIKALSSKSNVQIRSLGYSGSIVIIGFLHYGLTESVFFHPTILNFYLFCVVCLLGFIINESGSQRPVNQIV